MIFLYFVLKGINWNLLLDSIKNVSIPVYLSSLFFTFLAFWFRAVRWKILLRPVGDYSIKDLFGSLMIGFMANNIFPARAGEIIRAYSSGKTLKISTVTSFATIILERIFDGIVIVGFLLISIFLFPFPEIIKKTGYLIGFGYLILLIILFFFQKSPEKTGKIIKKTLFFLPHSLKEKIDSVIQSFIEGFHILKDFKQTIVIILYSFLVWIASAMIIYVVLYSNGMVTKYDLPLFSSMVVLTITAIGAMVPAAPGYIGTSQYFTIIALAVFSMTKTESLAFSILHFISQYIPINLLGLYYVYSQHISLKTPMEEENNESLA